MRKDRDGQAHVDGLGMSFRFDTINPGVIDEARQVFKKPSTQWTEDDHKRAVMIIEALRIVASHYKPSPAEKAIKQEEVKK